MRDVLTEQVQQVAEQSPATWYWGEVDGPDSGPWTVQEHETGKTYKVNRTDIRTAIQRVKKEHPGTAAAEYIRRDDIDYEAADVVWQVATLGEIIYG